jgi:CheY-like chemotaxis protein
MTGRPLRALVADDDPAMLQMVCEAVERYGAVVTQAETGSELIQRLADSDFELVITDVSMPWMTGLQAMHSAQTAGLTLPIVVITAHRDDRIVRQVRALGDAATLLYKPFGVEQLHAAIRTVLDAAAAAKGVQPGA